MSESAAMAVYHIYILASASGVLYIGVTNHLERRLTEHRQQLCPSFTKKYEVFRLVHFEPFGDVRNAISREKQLKRWSRAKKLALIRATNPKFRDLSGLFPMISTQHSLHALEWFSVQTSCPDPSTPLGMTDWRKA
jgi:putative endonuclease